MNMKNQQKDNFLVMIKCIKSMQLLDDEKRAAQKKTN